MGHFNPILFAFMLNSNGVYIFTTPQGFDCLPYLSYLVFLLAVSFLLWDVKLKPTTFRKLYGWAEFIIEFVVSMMIMELIMNNFWFPLEMAFLSFLPKIPELMEKSVKAVGFRCTGICQMFEFFKWEGTLWAASHALSLFFFLCIIHATRVVDFRILKRCGGGAFVQDTTKRGRAFCASITIRANNDCSDCSRRVVNNQCGISDNRNYSGDRCYDLFEIEDFCSCGHSSCSSN